MRFGFGLMMIVLLFFSFSGFAFGESAANAPAKSQDAQKENSLKPFDEMTKDTEKQEGLFNLYKTKDGKIYLEIHENQLNLPFLFTIFLNQGMGWMDIVSGTPLNNFLCEFRRVNDNLQFIETNPYFTAHPQSTLAEAVKRDFAESVLGSMKILSENEKTHTILADADSLFLSDLAGIASMVSQDLKGTYSLDSSKSFVSDTRAFPLNIEITAEDNLITQTQPKNQTAIAAVPDWRSIPLGLHYSIAALPKDHYVPRVADERVGYFETAMLDFSSKNPDTPVVHYINRWNMAKKPIVFWIQNTTPPEYREAMKAGVLEWNKAFAKIGIPDALEARVQPDKSEWEPGDIRYNVIYWIGSLDSSFAAIGPSEVNPFTGEIYNASVVIDGEAIRNVQYIYRYEIGLQENNSPSSLLSKRACVFQSLEQKEGMLGALLLGLQSPDQENFKAPESFMNAYVKDLVMHEIGHCLGLRHNFHASTLLSLKQIDNKNITQKVGLASSVMDYLPVNIAPKGEPQGDYFDPTIGPYDKWAIAYGYTPGEMLSRIASRSGNPAYAYETDEDSYSPFSADPMSEIFDLTSDPLGYSVRRFKLYHSLFKIIDKKLPFAGKGFEQIRKTFDFILRGYESNVRIPVRTIGGEYFSRQRAGDSKGKLPLQTVKKSLQWRALGILDRYVFNENAFSFPPEFLNKMAPPRAYDRFSGLQPFLTPFYYPIREKISEIQNAVLNALFLPTLQNRLLDQEKEAAPGQVLTLNNLFNWMSSHFYSELSRGGNISDSRRMLQDEYLERLVKLVVNPQPQMFADPEDQIPPTPIATVPQDARNLAELQLKKLRVKMESILRYDRRNLNDLTAAHLESSIKLIDQALNAKVQQSL